MSKLDLTPKLENEERYKPFGLPFSINGYFNARAGYYLDKDTGEYYKFVQLNLRNLGSPAFFNEYIPKDLVGETVSQLKNSRIKLSAKLAVKDENPDEYCKYFNNIVLDSKSGKKINLEKKNFSLVLSASNLSEEHIINLGDFYLLDVSSLEGDRVKIRAMSNEIKQMSQQKNKYYFVCKPERAELGGMVLSILGMYREDEEGKADVMFFAQPEESAVWQDVVQFWIDVDNYVSAQLFISDFSYPKMLDLISAVNQFMQIRPSWFDHPERSIIFSTR
ncbi:MAG: hypothetical protein QXY05_04280 [Candidatus Anstonellales archaeon]